MNLSFSAFLEPLFVGDTISGPFVMMDNPRENKTIIGFNGIILVNDPNVYGISLSFISMCCGHPDTMHKKVYSNT